jgi:hypothetical protein
MTDNGNGEAQDEFRFEQEVEKLLRQEPFMPFQVILTSGDRFDVTSPFSLAFRGNAVVVFPPRQAHIFFRKNQLVGVEGKELAE